MTDSKIRLGISACLLGQEVRWNGGHCRDPFLTETLGKYVEYVPVCPEVECGMPIPREAVRQVGEPAAPRLVTRNTGRDVTEQMTTWAAQRVAELDAEDLCGFIFKSDSPSSGMERVKVYNERGIPVKKGIGLFARAFMEHFPLLPVEEEGRLHDEALRENFIERIFTLKRWRESVEARRTIANLVAFHTRHKLLLLSHSPKRYAELGRLVAHAKAQPAQVFGQYQALLMAALREKATPRKHTNVLMHAMGYFKEQLSADEKQELLEILSRYREGLLPLIVPVTLLSHYVRKYRQPYLAEQVYLHPHPLELKLRNHA